MGPKPVISSDVAPECPGVKLSGTLTNSAGYITLTYVSESLEFASDLKAEEFGVPLGGLYRTGSDIKIRMS